MAKEIIILKAKADLHDVVLNKIHGVDRHYILSPNPKTKLDKLVYLASMLSKKSKSTSLLEVQYTYGRRAKRLEVVSINDNEITIYKISKKSNIDKDSLELDQVITSLKLEFKGSQYNFAGCLVFDQLPVENVINSVKKILSNQIDFIQTIQS